MIKLYFQRRIKAFLQKGNDIWKLESVGMEKRQIQNGEEVKNEVRSNLRSRTLGNKIR
jgi:hypothetical protein